MVTISSLLVALIRIMCTALPSSSAKLVLDGNIMNRRSPAYLNVSFKKISLPSPWKGFFSQGTPPPPREISIKLDTFFVLILKNRTSQENKILFVGEVAYFLELHNVKFAGNSNLPANLVPVVTLKMILSAQTVE